MCVKCTFVGPPVDGNAECDCSPRTEGRNGLKMRLMLSARESLAREEEARMLQELSARTTGDWGVVGAEGLNLDSDDDDANSSDISWEEGPEEDDVLGSEDGLSQSAPSITAASQESSGAAAGGGADGGDFVGELEHHQQASAGVWKYRMPGDEEREELERLRAEDAARRLAAMQKSKEPEVLPQKILDIIVVQLHKELADASQSLLQQIRGTRAMFMEKEAREEGEEEEGGAKEKGQPEERAAQGAGVSASMSGLEDRSARWQQYLTGQLSVEPSPERPASEGGVRLRPPSSASSSLQSQYAAGDRVAAEAMKILEQMEREDAVRRGSVDIGDRSGADKVQVLRGADAQQHLMVGRNQQLISQSLHQSPVCSRALSASTERHSMSSLEMRMVVGLFFLQLPVVYPPCGVHLWAWIVSVSLY